MKRRPGKVPRPPLELLPRCYWVMVTAVSSIWKLVASEVSSVPVNFRVTAEPLNAMRLIDCCAYAAFLFRLLSVCSVVVLPASVSLSNCVVVVVSALWMRIQ